jgi:hypothetical protein
VIDENGEFASSEDLDDLTAEEHTNLQSVWVVFDEKIDALFVTE